MVGAVKKIWIALLILVAVSSVSVCLLSTTATHIHSSRASLAFHFSHVEEMTSAPLASLVWDLLAIIVLVLLVTRGPLVLNNPTSIGWRRGEDLDIPVSHSEFVKLFLRSPPIVFAYLFSSVNYSHYEHDSLYGTSRCQPAVESHSLYGHSGHSC
jgi:hypothetical protein